MTLPSTPEALCRLIRTPEAGGPASAAGWEPIVAAARQARLLGVLATRLEAADRLDAVPAAPRRQLRSAQRHAEHEAGQIAWTLRGVRRALGPEARVVLLKGAAYWAQSIPQLCGRSVGDVDILVPRPLLEAQAARLAEAGWRAPRQSDYDRRYYLDWSHEWPPLQKAGGGLELDLHWHIVPPVGRPYFAVEPLWQRVRPVARGEWLVLDPVDQVLHACVHLLQHTTLANRLRDVCDVDALVRRGTAEEAAFGERLALRAAELGLTRPAWYGLALARRWFGTPLGASLAQARPLAPPPVPSRLAMGLLLALTLPPPPERGEGWTRRAAEWALLARHHWMRLRPVLLLRHLRHKAAELTRGRGRATPAAAVRT